MVTIQTTEDFNETKTFSYKTLGEAVMDFEKYNDHGFAAWSRRVELRDGDEVIATKWFAPKYIEPITLQETVVRIKQLAGMDGVDRFLDLHKPAVPWEMCMDCEVITPRDPNTLACLFKEEHE